MYRKNSEQEGNFVFSVNVDGHVTDTVSYAVVDKGIGAALVLVHAPS